MLGIRTPRASKRREPSASGRATTATDQLRGGRLGAPSDTTTLASALGRWLGDDNPEHGRGCAHLAPRDVGARIEGEGGQVHHPENHGGQLLALKCRPSCGHHRHSCRHRICGRHRRHGCKSMGTGGRAACGRSNSARATAPLRLADDKYKFWVAHGKRSWVVRRRSCSCLRRMTKERWKRNVPVTSCLTAAAGFCAHDHERSEPMPS